MSRVMQCANCKDKTGEAETYQNGQYGKGNRVFNLMKSKTTVPRYRCTVCLHEQEK